MKIKLDESHYALLSFLRNKDYWFYSPSNDERGLYVASLEYFEAKGGRNRIDDYLKLLESKKMIVLGNRTANYENYLIKITLVGLWELWIHEKGN
jgi:hypothetical protein